MMRPIKFRIWDKRFNRIDIPFEIEFDESGDIVRVDGRNDGYSDDDFELLQYTGLEDENGKEIYEGDILKFKDWLSLYDDEPATMHGIVMWDDESALWIVGGRLLWKTLERCHGVVVGNMYENPELMEVRDG